MKFTVLSERGLEMCGLKICLWVAGVLCVFSAAGMLVPVSTWESVAEFFGAEELFDLDTPVAEYMVRLMLATYTAIGVFLIILAMDPLKYGVMVPFTGVAALVLGLICAVTGLLVGMPAKWFLSDSVPCVVLGVAILGFWQKAVKK